MKYFTTIVAVMLLSAGTASAGVFDNFPGQGQDDCPGNSCHNATNVDVDTDVDVNVHNVAVSKANAEASAEAVATQEQAQGQVQGQLQTQGNAQTITFEDAPNTAASAPNLFLANCTTGASGQGLGGGGSIGGPDDVCQLLNLAIVAKTLGHDELSDSALLRADKMMRERTNTLVRFFQAIPLVRRVF